MQMTSTYRVYKKVRVSPHIFTLPLKLFYVLVLGVALIFLSLLGGFSLYGLFFRIVLMIVLLCILIEAKNKLKKFQIYLGEKLPFELNLKLNNPHLELNYYIGILNELKQKQIKAKK